MHGDAVRVADREMEYAVLPGPHAAARTLLELRASSPLLQRTQNSVPDMERLLQVGCELRQPLKR